MTGTTEQVDITTAIDETTDESPIDSTLQPEETTQVALISTTAAAITQTIVGTLPTLTTPSTPLIDDAVINKELDCCGGTTATDKTVTTHLPTVVSTVPPPPSTMTTTSSPSTTTTAAVIETFPMTMFPAEELSSIVTTEDEPLDLLTDPSPTDEPDWFTDYVTMEQTMTTSLSPITTTTTTIPSLQTQMTTTEAPTTTVSSNSNCPLDLCLNGGTCVATVDGWQCRCWWRYEGRRCQLANKVKVPQFHGNSYLSYAVPERTARQEILQVRIEFSTTSPIGLITYIHRSVYQFSFQMSSNILSKLT